MGKKKDNFNILLRIDAETNKILTNYSKMVGKSKNQLIRDSIVNLMFLNTDNLDYPNPKLIFSHSMMHFLFDKCNSDDLKNLAQISFDLSMKEFNSTDAWKEFLNKEQPEILAKGLVKYVLSQQGHAWFDTCDYIMRGSHISIYGAHNLGPKFHLFTKHLLSLYFDLIDYKLIRDRQNYQFLVEQSKLYDMRNVERKFYKFSVTFAPKD